MRIKPTVSVRATEDAGGNECLVGPSDPTLETETLDGLTLLATGKITVAPGATESVPFGAITTSAGVLLRSTGNFNMSMNGGSESFAVKKAVSTSPPDYARFYLDGELTAVSVGNPASPGTPDIVIDYRIWA